MDEVIQIALKPEPMKRSHGGKNSRALVKKQKGKSPRS
jgi:hypothetical protein